MSPKKIAYISGSRADFGLMSAVLKAIEKSEALSLQVYATGMHLMPEYGETVNEVQKIFPHVKRIDCVFTSHDKPGMARFAGELLSRVVSLFSKDRPDVVLVLGDRVEMFTIATACLYLGIPIGHIHGGERTGTVDEVARHAISKMASLHFTAIKESGERLYKMGEEEGRIHLVGAPALDIILQEKLPTREEVCMRMGLNPAEQFILLVQHAVSDEVNEAGQQMEETLQAVKSFTLPILVVYPNTDPGGEKIIEVIERERSNPLFKIYKNIPYIDFLALEREAAVWVGNSSGALIEAPSFGTPVVTIGTRQRGRERARNVIDSSYHHEEIRKAIERSLSKPYRQSLIGMQNPWGDGKTGLRIAEILKKCVINGQLLAKQITY